MLFGSDGKLTSGFYSNFFITTTNEGQNQNRKVQEFQYFGIPLVVNYVDEHTIVDVHQIILFPVYRKEDHEFLNPIKKEKQQSQIKFFSFQNTLMGAYYENLFLTFGYADPYHSTLDKNRAIFGDTFFPSLDVRVQTQRHIFVFSPIYWTELSQRYERNFEDNNIHFIHQIKKDINFQLSNHQYKLHYSFLFDFFALQFGYYRYEQENPYSNKKNFIGFDYYDFRTLFFSENINLRLRIANSKGSFSNSNVIYPIFGYKYQFSLFLEFYPFQLYFDGSKTTKSKFDPWTQKYKYFGYTSFFSEYVPSPQLSSTYDLIPHYQICFESKNPCEGILYYHSDFSFNEPADTFYMKLKFLYYSFQLAVGVGYIELFKIKKNPIEIGFDTALWDTLILKKPQQRWIYIEPFLQVILKYKRFLMHINYSQFYQKHQDPQKKPYNEISKNFLFSFLFLM